MIIFKCKMCGGNVESVKGKRVAKCEYCGSKMTLPDPNDEKIVNLYNRANDFRLTNQFDKAYGVYETILEIDNREVEAHWGILLCKYGVEYIDDPETGEKVPTCHRTIPTSIFKDIEFKVIEENADEESLEVYKEEAKRIDKIQKGILEVSSKEDPYDVFICYKETDSKGERTHDSVIAQDIYDRLTANGYKVFFSRITLENKLGTEYEAYIYSVLKSAKAMLVVGTTEENFNAIWVKNEWSRYLEMMKEDNTKALIPVYSKIDAYKLPEEFAMLQAQSMDKIGAMQDLTRGIEKIISESKIKGASELDKFKKAMDEASNLGNGKYEVVVMREKPKAWYYGFLLVFGCAYAFFLLTFIYVDSLFSIFNSSNRIDIVNFWKYIDSNVVILHLLSAVVAGISMLLPFFGRKHFRRSKYLITIAIFIELIYILNTAKYGYIDLNIVPLMIAGLVWLIKPRWHIDSSLKLVVDKERKEKIQKENDTLVKNFEEKDKKVVNKFVYLILFAILFVLVIFNGVYVINTKANGKNKNKTQIQVINEYAGIYSDEDLKYIIARAEYEGYYDIIEEVSGYDVPNGFTQLENVTAYKVETENGIIGYISASSAKKIYGRNDPLYGVEQTNERDTSVLQVRVITDYINLRKQTNLYSSSIIGKVYKDEIYTVLGITETNGRLWYKIRTTFGVEGYIADRYVNEDTNRITMYLEVLDATN